MSLGGVYYKIMKWYSMNTIAYLFFGSTPITSQISEFKQAY